MTIAEKIRLTRQRKELSQKNLAEKSTVNLKILSRYKLGSSMPPADAFKLIADALGVSSNYLLNDNNIEIKDKELLKKFEVFQQLSGDTKKAVDNFLDTIVTDHKTKQAYDH